LAKKAEASCGSHGAWEELAKKAEAFGHMCSNGRTGKRPELFGPMRSMGRTAKRLKLYKAYVGHGSELAKG
jgi:hypothetical protein